MLARLEATPGVTLAEVDHSGELLRLRTTSQQALSAAVAALRELGYGAEEVGGAPEVEQWYGRDSVRELSREEADVIARRVVDAFAHSRAVPPSVAATLEDLVARALYGRFASITLDADVAPGRLRREAASAVEVAARELLGPDGARDLALVLSSDLDRATSTEPHAG